MTTINRRQWLKRAGISSALLASAGYPLDILEAKAPTHKSYFSSSEMVRLSSNENPYGPSKSVKEAMKKAMDISFQYPPGHYKPLLEKIAQKEGVTTKHILLVSGSNEGLRVAGLSYGLNGGEIITCSPTYNALMSYAEDLGAKINAVPLDENLGFDLNAMADRVSDATKMIFLCNPNNPTGTLLDPEKVKDFCDSMSAKTLVFSDEAYYDYITDDQYPSMVSLVKEGKNVIVSRTFSKVYGMAGVRVGYLIAQPETIEMLKPRVMSYVNMMGVYGAMAALDDSEFHKFSLNKNSESKEYIYQVSSELGMRYIPSSTNFVFINTGVNINELLPKMMDQGVMVGRPFPPLMDWCRVSTGTLEEMDQWGQAMRKIFA